MSNENSRVDYQSGSIPHALAPLANSGDNKKYNTGVSTLSDGAVITPDGVINGGVFLGTAVVNQVSIGSVNAVRAGLTVIVNAGTLPITRAAADGKASVTSIIINAAGAWAAIKGTDGATASFSESRGVAGSAPYIPVGAIEVGQIRTVTNVAGVLGNTEFYQTAGTHAEHSLFPVFDIDNFTGSVNFDFPLAPIHTGDVSKAVYGTFAEPIYTEQKFSNDFVPADTSYSTASEQVYSATIGSSSSSLGQASFTAVLKDGITDPILALKGQNLMFRYFQDRNKPAHILTQGVIGFSRTFGASDNPKVSVSISPSVESQNRAT